MNASQCQTRGARSLSELLRPRPSSSSSSSKRVAWSSRTKDEDDDETVGCGGATPRLPWLGRSWFVLLPLLLPLSLWAQPFSADWHRAGAPGGASSSAAQRVSGSAGQAEAGVMSGGGYRIRGGFWSGLLARGYGTPQPFPTSVALSPDRGFAGQTFTASGKVAPGSPGVRILWDDGKTTLGLAERAVDPDGSFNVQLQVPARAAPGPVSLVALPSNSQGADTSSAAFTVEAAPAGSLSGRIAGNGGATPVPNANVRLLDPRGFPIASTTTDAQGNYTFAGLLPGDYLVAANKDGYFVPAEPTTVPAGGQGINTLQPVPLENLPVPAVVTFVGGLALPFDALKGFKYPVLVTDQISAKNTGVIASFGSLPPEAGAVRVRFWADATFPETTPQKDRAVLFEVLDAAGTALWKVKKTVLTPVFASEPLFNYPAYTSATPTLIQADMNVSAFPPGEVYLRATPFIGNQAGYGKLYTIEMADLAGRWFRPWVKLTPDPQTGLPLRFNSSSGSLTYIFNGALPNSATLPFKLDIPVPVFDYTFKNQLSVGVETMQEVFVAAPGEGLRPGAIKPKLKTNAKLMSQDVFDNAWPYQPVLDASGQTVAWQIKNFTAAGPTKFATIPIYQNGPGVGCWDPCPDIVCGCDCPVCLGWKLSVEFTLGGYVNLSSAIKENFGLEVTVTPAVDGTLGGYLKARGLICGADAHVTGTVTVELPIRYRSEPDSAELLEPCITLEGDIGADVSCLGIGFGAGGTIGPEEIYGCTPAASAAPAVKLQLAAAVQWLQVDPAPAVAASGLGRAVNVWIENEGQAPNALEPFVYARFYSGLVWGAAHRVTPNAAMVSEPKAGFVADNRAVAVWVQNKEPLATIVTAGRTEPGLKEIYYAVWNDAAWSAPAAITDDSNADGSLALATDRAKGRAVAAWVRRLNAPEAGTPQSVFAIVYSVFNGTTWSAPLPITLDAPAVDSQVTVEHDAAGNAWAAWLRDADGNLATYADRQLYVSKFLGDGWSEPERIPNTPAGAFSPALALDSAGQPLVVFLVPPKIKTELTSGLGNRSALWTAYKRAGQWETAAVGPDLFAETPEVEINKQDQATIMFRRFSRDDLKHRDGDLAAATADLAKKPLQWTSEYLTDDGQTNWKIAYAVDAATEQNFVVNVKQAPLTGVFAAGALPARRLARTPAVEVRQAAAEGPAVASMIFSDQPDLTVTSEDLTFSNSHPLPDDTVTITANVHNQGLRTLAEGGSFVVKFYDGPPTLGAPPFHQATITQPLALGETVAVTASYRVSRGGLRDLTVEVDADNQVTESDESNNTASAVLGQVPAPSGLIVQPDFETPAINLEWDAPATGGLRRYEVYRAGSPGAAFALVGSTTETSFVDTLVIPGQPYRYAVAARDDFGVRSSYSDEVPAALPNVQPEPSRPALSIFEAAGEITIAWFDPTGDYVLQETDRLSSAAWTSGGAALFAHDNQRQVIFAPSDQARFFRLAKP